MLLSRSAEHGIRITLHLAAEGQKGFVPVRHLADRCGVPFYFLGKICHRLTRAGILDSYKGPNGGVALSKPTAEIRVLDIVEALDGLAGFDRCLLGLDFCENEAPCPMHEAWKKIKGEILEMMSAKTLAQLAEELVGGKTYLGAGIAVPAKTE